MRNTPLLTLGAAAIGAISALAGAWIGAGVTNQANAQAQTKQERVDAYNSELTADEAYIQVLSGIGARWPESCLQASVQGKIGGSECRLTDAEVNALRDAVSKRYVAMRSVELVGSARAVQATYQAGVDEAHAFTADPAVIALPKRMAQEILARRGLGPAPLGEDAHVVMIRTLTCDVGNAYYEPDPTLSKETPMPCP